MRTIGILAYNSWQENLRNRFFLLALLFSGLVLYMSLLLGLLAQEQEVRALLDFGLAFVELMGLVGAVYGAATIILREMEMKTIYLILTRPVRRHEFLLGRFLGLMLSVLAAMGLMSAAHMAILFAKGWSWDGGYAWAFCGAYLKVLVTASLALFAALFSTSVLSTLTTTGIIWSLGHFLPEIRFLIAHKARQEHAEALMALAYVLPNFQLYNLRDRLDAVSLAPPEASLAIWLGYAAGYAGIWIGLSHLLLRQKEF